MRINEITEPNDMWRLLREVKIDFGHEFAMISQLLEFLISQKTPSRNAYWIQTIESFEQDVTDFLNENFPDASDEDLINLRKTCQHMLTHIASEKAKLAV